MTKSQIAASAVGAVAVPVFDFLYGEAEAVVTIMVALLFFIIMNWLSGIRAAKKDNTYASNMELMESSEHSLCCYYPRVGICLIWCSGCLERFTSVSDTGSSKK